MPQIQRYQQQTQTSVGGPSKQGGIDVSSGSRAAASAVANNAERLTRIQEDTNIANANAAFIDFQKEYLGERSNYDQTNLDGNNYTQDLSEVYNKKANEIAGNLSPGAQHSFRELTNKFSVAATQANMQSEALKKAQHKTVQTNKSLEGYSESSFLIPELLKDNVEAAVKLISSRTDIPETAKQTAIDETKKTLAMSAIHGRLGNDSEDPQTVIDDIARGEYDDYLTVAQKETAVGKANSEITFRRERANRAEVKTNKEVSTKFSSEYTDMVIDINKGLAGPADIDKFIEEWKEVPQAQSGLRALSSNYSSGAAETSDIIQDEVELQSLYATGEISSKEYRARANKFRADYPSDDGAKAYLRMIKSMSGDARVTAKKEQAMVNVAQAMTDPSITMDYSDSDVRDAVDSYYKETMLTVDPAQYSEKSLNIAVKTGVVPKTILDSIRLAKNPDQRYQAASAVKQIISTGMPVLARQIDATSLSYANELVSLVAHGRTPEEAVAAQSKTRMIDADERKRRADVARGRFGESNKDKHVEEVKDRLDKYIDTSAKQHEGTFWGNPAMNKDFLSSYDATYTQEFILTNDEEASRATAFELTTRRFSVSSFGAFSSEATFTRDAPDQHYALPGMTKEENAEWMTEQALEDIGLGDDVEGDSIRYNIVPGKQNKGKPVYELYYTDSDGMPGMITDWYPEITTSSAYKDMEAEENAVEQAARDKRNTVLSRAGLSVPNTSVVPMYLKRAD